MRDTLRPMLVPAVLVSAGAGMLIASWVWADRECWSERSMAPLGLSAVLGASGFFVYQWRRGRHVRAVIMLLVVGSVWGLVGGFIWLSIDTSACEF